MLNRRLALRPLPAQTLVGRTCFAALGLVLGLSPAGLARAEDSLSTADLLRRVIDVDRLMRPPASGERSLLFSSFDRACKRVEGDRYVAWDSNHDAGQFLGKSPDGWDLLASVEAPGVVNRIWVEHPAGEVRVSVDGEKLFEGPLRDFFDSGSPPFGEPYQMLLQNSPCGLSHVPIGFASNLQIATREFAGTYQIDVTAFGGDTAVQPQRIELDAEAQAALKEVSRTFSAGLSEKTLLAGRKTMTLAAQQDLATGEKLELTYPGPAPVSTSRPAPDAARPAAPRERAGTVRALYVSLTDRTEPRLYALNNCVLRIFWDGAAEPDVEAPLTAFFGAAFDRDVYRGLAVGTYQWMQIPAQFDAESWFLYSYFPMPFSRSLRLEIENRNRDKRPLGVMAYLRIDRDAPPADALRFRARFRREAPCRSFDVPLLETGGRGRWVGLVLGIDAPRREWWGSGDHKIWLDGEAFPSIWGCDTAGLFGNVTGLKPTHGALSGVTRTAPYGRSSMYRWMLADSVAYHKGIRVALENWQEHEANDVDYSTVTCWYGEPGAAPTGFARLTDDDLAVSTLRVPNAIEFEDSMVGEGWGNLVQQKHYRDVEFSNGAAVTIAAEEQPVASRISVEKAGRYKLQLRVAPKGSFGKLEVRAPAGTPIGTVEWSRDSDGVYDVGDVDLKAGENRLTIVRTGKSPLLDCWMLEPR